MAIKRETVVAGCSILALVVATACGDEQGAGEQRAQAGGSIGNARIATQGSPQQVGGGSDLEDEVVEGEPSLDQLDGSGPAPGAVGSPGTSCSGGQLAPSKTNLAAIARSTVCLLNLERKGRGLSRLRANRQLARAALDHARDMVSKSYFAHESPGGRGFIGRIKARGYLVGHRSWTVGENLAWGGGSAASPREIVASWMGSPPHRANILNRHFRDVGLGIVVGAPVQLDGAIAAATYGSEFGVRPGR